MTLEPGRSLTHFEILGPLGAGGMGEVYRARDARLDRVVAIKVLPDALRQDPDRRARFLREARAVAKLGHPNIAQILDVGEAEGLDYIAFELVEGETLAFRVAGGALGLEEVVELALPLADALAYAHERGVLHRDLKPANVMVTSRGHAKLLDFGLAKVLEDREGERTRTTTLTLQGAVFGTPTAMSPEQALGRPLDARSDVFSFGSLLYEMASGRPAFAGSTAMEVMDAVIHREPTPLGRVRPELPEGFVAIVAKALRKDAGERYQTMGDLAADLRHFRRTTESGLVPPATSRRRVVGAAVGLGLAVAVVAGAWWAAGRSGGSGGPGPPADGVGEAATPHVAVMGFENLSDPSDAEALGRMLASLVATDLAEHGGLRVVSTAKVLASLEEARQGASAPFSLATATRAAKATGASVMLVGQILRQGEGVLLNVEVVDVASGERRGSLTEKAASAEEVFELAGALGDAVRRQLGVDAGGAFELSRSLTDSPEAYRDFNAGELAMHQRDFSLARTFFQRAIESDPTFAMAWFRLGMTSDWLNLPDGTRAFEQALAHVDRLSERWRAVCVAAAARARGDQDTAFEVLTPLVEAGIDIPEAYNELGETLTHSSRYRDPLGSRRSFARALDLDPTYEIVLYHLVNQTLMAGELDEAKALVERMTLGGKVSFGKLAILLAERRYADAVAEAERQLSAHGSTDWEEYLVAARKLGDLDLHARAADAWRIAVPSDRYACEWEEAAAGFLRGRFASVDEHLDRSVALSTDEFHRAVADLLRAQLAFGAGDLEACASAARTVLDRDPYEFEATFWLGLSRLRGGRPDDAARALHEGRAALERSRNTLGPGYLLALEAALASAAGDPARAHALLDEARSRPIALRQPELESLVEAYAAEAEGDVPAALAAWRAVLEPTYLRHIMSLDLDVWPLYEIGRLEDDHGDPAAAQAAFERYLAAWGDADRPLAQIADARARLARLAGR